MSPALLRAYVTPSAQFLIERDITNLGILHYVGLVHVCIYIACVLSGDIARMATTMHVRPAAAGA